MLLILVSRHGCMFYDGCRWPSIRCSTSVGSRSEVENFNFCGRFWNLEIQYSSEHTYWVQYSKYSPLRFNIIFHLHIFPHWTKIWIDNLIFNVTSCSFQLDFVKGYDTNPPTFLFSFFIKMTKIDKIKIEPRQHQRQDFLQFKYSIQDIKWC